MSDDVLSPEDMALLPPEVQEALREWGPDGPAYVTGRRVNQATAGNGKGKITPREHAMMQAVGRLVGDRINRQTAAVLEAVRIHVENKVGGLKKTVVANGATTQRIELPAIQLNPPEVRVEAPTVNLDTSALGEAVAEAVAAAAAGVVAELRVLSQRQLTLIELLLAYLAERQRPPAFRLETLSNGDRRIVPEPAGE